MTSTAAAAPETPCSGAAPKRCQRRQRLTVLAFAPWLLGVTIFFIYPLVDTLYLSFTRYDLLSSPKWVGCSNYVFMATKDPSGEGAYNTLWLVAILVPARMLFASPWSRRSPSG